MYVHSSLLKSLNVENKIQYNDRKNKNHVHYLNPYLSHHITSHIHQLTRWPSPVSNQHAHQTRAPSSLSRLAIQDLKSIFTLRAA